MLRSEFRAGLLNPNLLSPRPGFELKARVRSKSKPGSPGSREEKNLTQKYAIAHSPHYRVHCTPDHTYSHRRKIGHEASAAFRTS
ncbi:hypothetical protein EVAR_92368_1 [Eumeta japonica]|uniref:Uncharacterized protein n=1 Tax=Eumeta variegata TaxID=151549 RepID=A0A4C1TJL0_EUMVA|nr:hypothetical protein EVAR_92368_1 [Eumeta japonica]